MKKIIKQKTIKALIPAYTKFMGKSRAYWLKQNSELNKALNPLRTIKRQINKGLGMKILK